MERPPSGQLEAVVVSTDQLFATASEFAVLTIDIPIGLPERGPRSVDVSARRLLGPRASSVFPCPVRAALDGTSYSDACARSFTASGKKLSKQAFAILPKIREIDRVLRTSEECRARVREVHPEICFYYLNSLKPMAHSKKSKEGALERRELLEAHFGPVFDRLRATVPTRDVASDDILDALVALWSAERVLSGTNVVLPEVPECDRFGLRMEMVA